MMDAITPTILATMLFVAGVVLLLGELLLPTAGVLGILGGLSIAGSIGVAFSINQWAGLAMFVVVLLVGPMLGSWVLNAWPRTGVGRQVVLQPVKTEPAAVPVQIGQTGVAVTELRPMGEVEFDDVRLEAISERGIIRPGEPVKVVGVVNAKPTVRLVQSAVDSATRPAAS